MVAGIEKSFVLQFNYQLHSSVNTVYCCGEKHVLLIGNTLESIRKLYSTRIGEKYTGRESSTLQCSRTGDGASPAVDRKTTVGRPYSGQTLEAANEITRAGSLMSVVRLQLHQPVQRHEALPNQKFGARVQEGSYCIRRGRVVRDTCEKTNLTDLEKSVNIYSINT